MGQALRLNDIIASVTEYDPNADVDLIKKAYVYSAKVHAGQVRKTGEPYLIHPLAVASILSQLKLDVASVCTGLLHDTVEDTLATLEEIDSLFGGDIAHLVDGVTKLSQIKFQTSEEKLAENFRKMLVAMAKDIRVLLVKLADRLHNMRTLQAMKPEKQERIARETMDIYAPLANRLGISWLKIELEDLSFRYIKRREYKELAEKLGQTKKDRQKFISETTDEIGHVLEQGGMTEFETSGRPKHLWSIHKKMANKGIPFEDVYDLIAFRVTLSDVGRCYQALGHIHARWRPIPGRFKDYIAMPKPNGYQSLHTTVIGPKSQRIEIQIRTAEMDSVAEDGIAAHWVYKESGGSQHKAPGEGGFVWLRKLMDYQRDVKDPNEFLDSVKFDLFADEVFVFTPNGDVLELPRGACPVDFAFSIHTDVGMRCAGAKVNGSMVPLRHKLESGDTCEILTNKNQRPNSAWLEFVKTGRARTKIRAEVRAVENERCKQIGSELLDKEFKRFGHTLQKHVKDGSLQNAWKDSKYKTVPEVILAVGYGKLNAQQVVERVLPDDIKKNPSEDAPKRSRLGQLIDRLARKSSSGVTVEGVEDMLVHYAKCCSPIKGDPITGFVTRGRGLTIHRRGCDKVMALDPQRRIDVTWDAKESFSRAINIRITTDDREGMLADLSSIFSKHNINISEANCRADKRGTAINTFRCGLVDLEQLRRVVKALENVKGVHSVERARGD